MMKNIFLYTLVILTSLTAKSEIWFDVGAKGGYAPGAFTNAHLLESKTQRLKYSHGFLMGGKLGVNFGLTHALTVDGLFSQTNQTLVTNDQGNSYTLSLSSIDLPIMYRMNQDNGGYGEIGPQFSFTQGANISVNEASTDAKNRFNSSNIGVALGFGQYIGGSDLFGFNIGFRFAYTLADIVSSSAQNASSDPVFQPFGAEEAANYSYKPSGRLYGGVVLEVDFNLGYLAKGAKCSKKTRFRLF